MSFESDFEEIGDENKRISANQLKNFSDLDGSDLLALTETWSEIAMMKRLNIIRDLAELASDNIELNFDAIFKLALSDEEPYVRAAAIRGLDEYEGTDLIPAFIDMLLIDPDTDVRREAAIALGRFALAAELDRFNHADARAVRNALMESAEDMEEDERVRARAIEALGAMSGEDTENLIESIYQEESLWLKVGAIDAMGRTCSSMWLDIILRESENRAPEMRHAAAFAAGEIGEEAAVPQLRRMALQDPDREVQLAAIRSLGVIGGAQARVALQGVLYEGDEALQEAIEEAMQEIEFAEDPLGGPL
jgi:HEAT repeat protein